MKKANIVTDDHGVIEVKYRGTFGVNGEKFFWVYDYNPRYKNGAKYFMATHFATGLYAGCSIYDEHDLKKIVENNIKREPNFIEYAKQVLKDKNISYPVNQ